MNRQTLEYLSGTLIGGAVGDALGAPIKSLSLEEIFYQFGKNGISDYAMAYNRKGAITSNTQMMLFTAEGLILARIRNNEHIPTSVYQAYLRWLSTQNEVSQNCLLAQHGTCSIIDGLLISHQELYSRRSPEASSLSALQCNQMGKIETPINNSKESACVTRIAPAGLILKPDEVFDIACEIAAITHGNPDGILAAGSLAQIINALTNGADLNKAIELTLRTLHAKPHHEEVVSAIQKALDIRKTESVSFEAVEKLGKGWNAEEALSIGIYCSLIAENNFEKGVCFAVNHSGNSDSTGAIAGNLLGAMLGIGSIPLKYLRQLELIEVIQELSEDLFDKRQYHRNGI